MKKTIFLIFSLIFIFIIGCGNDNVELTKIEILTFPNQVEFTSFDDIDYDGLSIKLYYSNDTTKVIDNLYEMNIIHDDYHIGINEIKISYDEFIVSFNITINIEIELLDHNDYKDKTILNRNYSDYDILFEDVLYAKTRTANTMVVYNNIDFVKMNVYGKEALINEYGRVIEVSTNVDVTKGDMVVSAHGTRIKEIEDLNVGDYVIYHSGMVYVYRCDSLPFEPLINDLFCRFYDLEKYIETLDDYIEKNKIVLALNNAIPYLDKIYDNELVSDDILNEITEFFYSFNISEKVLEYCNKQEELSEAHNKFTHISNIDVEEEYTVAFIYNETLYYGGFRDTDTLVFYNSEYWRNRNDYGYEIAIDNNGYVIDMAVLVDLPDGGFILSGHGVAAQFLKDVHLGDYIEIKGDRVYFYRKPINTIFNEIIDNVNVIIDEINLDYDLEIRHDYELIDNIIKEINNYLPSDFSHDIFNIQKCFKGKYNLLSLTKKLASLSIVYDNDTVHGMWYYPLKDSIENTVDGLNERLDLIKSIGINNIFINPLASDGAIFPNSMYIYSPKAQSNNYEGYSDYLDCFISLAHSKGIKVTAFTQTFLHYKSLMKCNEEWTYQLDMKGEYPGACYLDICNDNVQEMLYDYYNELMQYDFDGIEYDIIRYSASGLYKYLDVEKTNKTYIEDPGWTEYAINKFISKYNLSKDADVKSLVLNSLDIRKKWLQYKEDELINFITNTSRIIKVNNPNTIISAAVLNNYDLTKNSCLQDYQKWLNLGIVDVVEPMNYNSNHSVFMNIYDFYYSNEYASKVRMGISNLLNGDDIVEDFLQLRYSMKYGYVIFSSTLYLHNSDYIKYMQLIYKDDR